MRAGMRLPTAELEPSRWQLDGSDGSEPSNRLNRKKKTVQQTVPVDRLL